MHKLIVDANVFFNMQSDFGLGETSLEVLSNLNQLANLEDENQHQFYLPPTVYQELLSFFEKPYPNELNIFIQNIIVKAPDLSNPSLTCHISLIYELIADIRHRSYRGLDIAEEELKAVATQFATSPAPTQKVELQKALNKPILRLRERYRRATRFGFIDSTADLDIIILAKELGASILTSDTGLLEWGRRFGVQEYTKEKSQILAKLQS